MTKKNKIEVRRALIVDYINSFYQGRCHQPISKICQMLSLDYKATKLDVRYLIENGRIEAKTKVRGYRTVRTLIGDPGVVSTYKLDEVVKEDYTYDGCRYRIPIALPRGTHTLISTTYRSRPQRNGKAMAIDYSAFNTTDYTPKPTPIPQHFAPFDEDDYTTQPEW